MNIRLYELTDEAYEYYKNHVKKNEGISYEMAQRKLTRNIRLSACLWRDGNHVVYLYGRLLIEVKRNKIVSLKNHMPVFNGWQKNNRAFVFASRRYRVYNAIKVK